MRMPALLASGRATARRWDAERFEQKDKRRRGGYELAGGLGFEPSVLNQKFLFTLGLNHDGAAAKPFDGGQDVVGGFGPAKGLGVGIAGVDEGGDGGLQRGG